MSTKIVLVKNFSQFSVYFSLSLESNLDDLFLLDLSERIELYLSLVLLLILMVGILMSSENERLPVLSLQSD